MKRNSPRSYSCDPVLSQFANQLKQITFDICPEDRQEFGARMVRGEFQNVTLFLDGMTYRVRFYLGGKQRVIGATQDGPTAARFADMARLFFWPYKLRNASEPVAASMNYSLALAQEDLATNEAALGLLTNIRDHLLQFNELKLITPEINAERIDKQQQYHRRKTARYELAEFLREQAAERKMDLSDAKAERTAFFVDLQKAFHHIRDTLDGLATELRTAADERIQLRVSLSRVEGAMAKVLNLFAPGIGQGISFVSPPGEPAVPFVADLYHGELAATPYSPDLRHGGSLSYLDWLAHVGTTLGEDLYHGELAEFKDKVTLNLSNNPLTGPTP